MKDVSVNAKSLKIFWMAMNQELDFRNVNTLEDLKTHLGGHLPACYPKRGRSCVFGHRGTMDSCPKLKTLLNNFIDSVQYLFDLQNQYYVEILVKLSLSFIEVHWASVRWVDNYTTDDRMHYHEGMQLTNHLVWSGLLLQGVSKFTVSLGKLQKDLKPKFYILVEGESEKEAFEILFNKNQFNLFRDHEIINLQGKDAVKKQAIKELLGRYRIPGIQYYLVLDYDKSVISFVNDLVSAGLIDKRRVIIWKKNFEDSVPVDFSIPLLSELINKEISIKEIKRTNKSKKDILATIKVYDPKIEIPKVEWAKKIAKKIPNAYGKIYKYKPKTELEKNIRKMLKQIEEDSHNFYMPTKRKKKWKSEVWSSSLDEDHVLIQ
ncbi:MAG: hypothetical protein IPJ89_00385 [Candidatus Iainarchaeum archaeon]|uniref:Uncharacterized protein n=1 Tax=Candidatus Iainarchaeum sp. TaxID=3101447 RepID=A0A7T9I1R4_9ARCH|nr:MAG: hypothetical protein IPJ89_00385 [Candidatus Diapherotrites archaeon]